MAIPPTDLPVGFLATDFMTKTLAFTIMLMTAILLNALVVGIVSSIVYGISYFVGFAFGIWHLTWLQSFAVGVVIWLLEAIRK